MTQAAYIGRESCVKRGASHTPLIPPMRGTPFHAASLSSWGVAVWDPDSDLVNGGLITTGHDFVDVVIAKPHYHRP